MVSDNSIKYTGFYLSDVCGEFRSTALFMRKHNSKRAMSRTGLVVIIAVVIVLAATAGTVYLVAHFGTSTSLGYTSKQTTSSSSASTTTITSSTTTSIAPLDMGAWTQTTSYPTGIGTSSCAVNSNYVYCVGGQNSTTGGSEAANLTNAVYFAELSSSGGIVGNWIRTTNYPRIIWNEACATHSGYIYCIGGGGSPSSDTQTVYYAELSPSGGILGNWMAATDYPVPIDSQSCTTLGDYIYCVGGATNTLNERFYATITNAVYYAQLSASGVGTWSSAANYAGYPYPLSCVGVNNQYIYCIGTEGAYFTDPIYYAQVSPSGEISGTWTQTTSYPLIVQLSNQGCVMENAHMICVAGLVPEIESYNTNATYGAQLSSNGGIIGWVVGTNYPLSVTGHSCFSSSDYVYCLGGGYSILNDTTMTVTNYEVSSVYYTSINSSL
jgi:hypothetical protein